VKTDTNCRDLSHAVEMTKNERCLMDKADPSVQDVFGCVISTNGRNL
jgi:hypothetical protein